MRELLQVRVRVRPGARRDLVREAAENVFEVQVKERAKRGAANARVRELIAQHFGVPTQRVRVLSGATSPNKRLGVVLE